MGILMEIAIRIIIVVIFLFFGVVFGVMPVCDIKKPHNTAKAVGWFCIAASVAGIVMAIWPSH